MRPLLLTLTLTTALSAQYPISANALHWQGATSTAGPFCWGFTCTPAAATILPGEPGTLTIRAEFNQPYLLGLSPTATSCISAPAISYNSLTLDPPITIWWTGTCSIPSPILACPSGYDQLPITIPPILPPGSSFSMQGITGAPAIPGSPAWSFTQAITFTVL